LGEIMQTFWFLVLGAGVGIVSGFFGIGGGVVMVPALVYLFGLTQTQAQGTSLAAMALPLGLLAAGEYWRHGNVKVGVAVFVCLGMCGGAFLGSHIAQLLHPILLKRLFGGLLLLVGAKMVLERV